MSLKSSFSVQCVTYVDAYMYMYMYLSFWMYNENMMPLYIGYSFYEIKKTFQTKKYLNIQLTMYLQRLNYLVNIQNDIFAHVHMHAQGKKNTKVSSSFKS